MNVLIGDNPTIPEKPQEERTAHEGEHVAAVELALVFRQLARDVIEQLEHGVENVVGVFRFAFPVVMAERETRKQGRGSGFTKAILLPFFTPGIETDWDHPDDTGIDNRKVSTLAAAAQRPA